MSQRKGLHRVVLAAVTAALLCGAPAQAIGWETGPPALFEKAWAWLAGRLAGPDGGSPEGDGGFSRVYQEAGACIDPDGCPSSVTSGPPVCQGDAGACIDPNG